jgi:hypothetical protein
VDVSSADVRLEMKAFVSDLSDLPAIQGPPTLFWLDDFELFLNEYRDCCDSDQAATADDLLEAFLADEMVQVMHGSDIIEDAEKGKVIASRTFVSMTIDFHSSSSQVSAYNDIRSVTSRHAFNASRSALIPFHF